MSVAQLKWRMDHGRPRFEALGPDLSPGQHQAWLLRFDEDAQAGHAGSLLTADEHARARAYRSMSARMHFEQTRAALRVLLAHYMDRAPEEIEFEYSAEGKPMLREGGAWQFNVAHSGDYAMLVVSNGPSVGVDIEQRHATADLGALVQAVLSPSEVLAWERLRMDEQEAAFFELWTRKESLSKAVGRGLGIGFSSVEVGWSNAGVRSVNLRPYGTFELASLPAPPGYAAALAWCSQAPADEAATS